MLIEHGVDVNLIEIMKVLVSYGADIEVKDFYGNTLFIILVENQ